MNATTHDPALEPGTASSIHSGQWPMLTLVRREFWEHRALWLTPLCIAVLLFAGAAIGHFDFRGMHLRANTLEALPLDTQRALFGGAVWAFSAPEYLAMSVVLWLYVSDCLYAERRDRSILFWKSMPISDAQTVISKLLVAMVVVPLGVWLFNILIGLIVSGIWEIRALTGSISGLFWDTATWLRVQGVLLVTTVVASLWYAPLTAYLLLVSAWARRNVTLWVLLPPLVAVLLERLVFGTHYLWTVIVYRFNGIWRTFKVGRLFSDVSLGPHHDQLPSWHSILAAVNPLPVLANIDLWLGLALAVVFVYGAIRIRRYRDDS